MSSNLMTTRFSRDRGVRMEKAGGRLKIGSAYTKNLVIAKLGELNLSCRDEVNRNLCTLLLLLTVFHRFTPGQEILEH